MRFSKDAYLASLLLLPIISIQTVYGCEMYRFVVTDDGQALEGHAISTITKLLTSQGMFECELNNSSKKANPSKMAPREGWSLHEMTQRSYCIAKTPSTKKTITIYLFKAKLAQKRIRNWSMVRLHL
ncbi:hypothetical protein AC249_AIPGENE24010 [Exaiptasia diaphana]|nr:hypothetical protein AC249_AIPGENE24010 [Exaiptasia diaphana]